MSDPNNQGQQTPPPPPPAAPPPPPSGSQGWQSTPQQPGQPPAGSGQPNMPSWTGNITARGTISGPGGIALANLTDRIIAWIIDAVIIGVVGYVVSLILGSVLRETRADTFLGVPIVVTGPSLVGQLIAALIIVGLSAAYFIYMWSRMNGQTVGNMVMKVSVRDASSGGAISQSQAISRWLVLGLPLSLYSLYYLPIALIGLLVWIGLLVYEIYLLYTTANSPTRQGFHDTYAKTVVAKVS